MADPTPSDDLSPVASVMDTLRDSFNKAVASRSHSLPALPSPTSDGPDSLANGGHAHDFATEEQHLTLRTLTWFLSKTNFDHACLDMSQTSPTIHQARNRYQRQLYDRLEALAILLERHHESISIVPADKNASRIFISRSYSTAAPQNFEHIDLDEETLRHFGPSLSIPEKYWNGSDSELLSGLPNVNGGKSCRPDFAWGQDKGSFNSYLFKAVPNDYPLPAEGVTPDTPSTYGYYLMRHSKAQVDDKTFVTDISFSEHCGNVVDAIKRTHLHNSDPQTLLKQHTSLSRYVYFSSATGIQERMDRGFTDFTFGLFLTLSVDEIFERAPTACGLPFECRNETSEVFSLTEHKITCQQQKVIAVLLDTLRQYGINHEHLDQDSPESLSKRVCFYDKKGRVMFHSFLAIIVSTLYDHVNSLVAAKRTAMETQIQINNNPDYSITTQRIQEIVEEVGHHTARTSMFFKMLDILRSDFGVFLNAHLTWIARIFGSETTHSPPTISSIRPDGLFDEFAPLSKDISDPAWTVSCQHWLRLLCLQESSMKALRFPLVAGYRDRILSGHIVKSKVSCISVSPPSQPTCMNPLKQWLQKATYNASQVNDVLNWLVREGKLMSVEGADQADFRGCIHAEALQLLLMCWARSKKYTHLSGTKVEVRGDAKPKLEKTPECMPRAAITSKMTSGRGLMVVSNKPFCAGCRIVVNQSLSAHVSGAQQFIHRGSRVEWTQFDLPPWTPQDVMSVAIRDAQRTASARIVRILQLAHSQRQEQGSHSHALDNGDLYACHIPEGWAYMTLDGESLDQVELEATAEAGLLWPEKNGGLLRLADTTPEAWNTTAPEKIAPEKIHWHVANHAIIDGKM